jgi:hypothetical protein
MSTLDNVFSQARSRTHNATLHECEVEQQCRKQRKTCQSWQGIHKHLGRVNYSLFLFFANLQLCAAHRRSLPHLCDALGAVAHVNQGHCTDVVRFKKTPGEHRFQSQCAGRALLNILHYYWRPKTRVTVRTIRNGITNLSCGGQCILRIARHFE